MVSVAVFSTLLVAFFSATQSTVTAQTEQQTRSELFSAGVSALRTIEAQLKLTGRVKVGYQAGALTGQTVSFPVYFIPHSTPTWLQSDGTSPVAAFKALSGINATVDLQTEARQGPLVAAMAHINSNAVAQSYFISKVSHSPPVAGDTPTRAIAFIHPGFMNPVTAKPATALTGGFPELSATSGQFAWRANAIHVFQIELATDKVHQLVERIVGNTGATTFPQGAFGDGATVHVLARHVQRVVFEDQNYQDPCAITANGTNPAALLPDQIRVTIFLAKLNSSGKPVYVDVQTTVTLRGTPDPTLTTEVD
jgi:hypothetical protein